MTNIIKSHCCRVMWKRESVEHWQAQSQNNVQPGAEKNSAQAPSPYWILNLHWVVLLQRLQWTADEADWLQPTDESRRWPGGYPGCDWGGPQHLWNKHDEPTEENIFPFWKALRSVHWKLENTWDEELKAEGRLQRKFIYFVIVKWQDRHMSIRECT